MSTTQAPPSTTQASEQISLHPDKSAAPRSTPNHTAAASNPPETIHSPPADSSVDKGKQNGSASSSRRSAKAEPQSAENTKIDTAAGTSPRKAEKRKTKSGASGFLSFLNCCGSSRQDDDVDLSEHAVPAQSPDRLQTSQQLPAKTQDVSAPESSTTESKDISVEKIGGTPYANLKSAGEPRTQDHSKVGSASASQDAQPPKSGERAEGGPTKLGEAVVAIQPASGDARGDSKFPAPTGGDAPAAVPSDGENVINDRTPQQEKIDTDIEMTDAPPAEHMAVEESRGADESKQDKTPPLPPPPPITPQRQDSSLRQSEVHDADQPSGANEQQKWLLPPVKPEHRGRKCLILDLDETLVHSSFKVESSCSRGITQSPCANARRYSTRPTSPSP